MRNLFQFRQSDFLADGAVKRKKCLYHVRVMKTIMVCLEVQYRNLIVNLKTLRKKTVQTFLDLRAISLM